MLYGFSSFFSQPFPLFNSENLYHFELVLKVGKIQEESGLESGGGGGVFFLFFFFFFFLFVCLFFFFVVVVFLFFVLFFVVFLWT